MAPERIPATAKPIALGFAEFQKESSDQSLDNLFGEAALAAISNAPQKPKFVRPAFDTRLKAGVALGTAGLIALFALREPGSALGALAFAGSVPLIYPALVIMVRSWMAKKEPSLPELIAHAVRDRQKQNLRGLDEFRRALVNGKIPAFVKFRNGSSRPLTDRDLDCFDADHGRLLIVSDDLVLWSAIRSRPIPGGEIWVDVQGRLASSKINAGVLIRETDHDRAKAKMVWLWAQAAERNITSGPFHNGLKVIEAFHSTVFQSSSLDGRAAEIAKQKGISVDVSFIKQMHSGNYPKFEAVLHSLPLEDMP